MPGARGFVKSKRESTHHHRCQELPAVEGLGGTFLCRRRSTGSDHRVQDFCLYMGWLEA